MKKTLENQKGFTLAELLVVVAIIAILVAIAIPSFTASRDRAQRAVEDANARSVHAEYMIEVLSGDTVILTGSHTKDYSGVTYIWSYNAPPTTNTDPTIGPQPTVQVNGRVIAFDVGYGLHSSMT